jgi:hypothetical protein
MGWGISATRASLALSQVASPDRESFHIGMARLAYTEGRITLDEFEESVAFVLRGGTLDQHGCIPSLSHYRREIEGAEGPLTLEGFR